MATTLYTLIIYPIYTLTECIFFFIRKIIDPIGISVIGISLGVSLLCLPLYAVADKWQQIERDKVKSMKPQLDRIKKYFSGDERYMMTTTYYKQCHYSPIMALRSSFGLLIQIPFFIAAYTFLSHLPVLNGASFLFIKDMGKPDALFQIGSFTVNILPIAMTTINIVSGIIYSKGHSLREKMQIFVMAAVFLVILYDSPSGLVIYWTCNNLFSLFKNIFYKLKNPLKVLWILACIAITAACIFVCFSSNKKFTYKIFAAITVFAIYALPIFLKGVKFILEKPLFPLVENKSARTVLYLISCALLLIFVGLALPSSLISSSPAEFSGIGSNPSPFGYIQITFLQAAGIFAFWAVCVYFLFGKKVQTVLTVFMVFLSLSSIANSFIFMLKYGDISATLQFLDAVEFHTISAISILNLFALFVLLVAIVAIFKFFGARIFSYSFGIAASAMLVFAFFNMQTISKEYKTLAKNGNLDSVEIEPIFHLSKNHKNVVIFMLDRAENQYVEEIFREDKNLADALSGFTLYKNTVSFNGHTMMGAPLLFGGYEYQPLEMNRRKDEFLYEKNNEALLLLPRIFTEQSDFLATTTDPSWANYSSYADLSITEPYEKISGLQTIGKYSTVWYKQNTKEKGLDRTDEIINRNLIFFSIFRCMPIFLREMIYSKGRFWSMNDSVVSYTHIIDNYAPLDFLPELTDFSETDGGRFVSIVNELSHSSVFMQAPLYVPAQNITDFGSSKYKNVDSYHTNMSAFQRIAEWARVLKENGVYDNTRIILVSDHSRADYEDEIEKDDALDEKIRGTKYRGRGHFHPILLVKDFGETGSLKTDMTFMTNGDVPSIALNGIVENPVNPFTNKPIPLDTSEIKKDGVVITSNDVHQAWLCQNLKTYPIQDDQWWRVKNSIFRADSWSQEEPPRY